MAPKNQNVDEHNLIILSRKQIIIMSY
jgi:hypothetical protein